MIPRFQENYSLGKIIGMGGASVVWQAHYAPTKLDRVVKVVYKQSYRLDEEALSPVKSVDCERELRMCTLLRHRYILPLVDYMEDANKACKSVV